MLSCQSASSIMPGRPWPCNPGFLASSRGTTESLPLGTPRVAKGEGMGAYRSHVGSAGARKNACCQSLPRFWKGPTVGRRVPEEGTLPPTVGDQLQGLSPLGMPCR